MAYDPDNKRHKLLGEGVHSEQRAINFSVQYDPIEREGRVLWQHRPYLYVNDVLSGVLSPESNDKVYRNLSDLVGKRPTPNEVIDPITGTDLSTVSGAGIQMWIEWLFNEEVNNGFVAEESR